MKRSLLVKRYPIEESLLCVFVMSSLEGCSECELKKIFSSLLVYEDLSRYCELSCCCEFESEENLSRDCELELEEETSCNSGIDKFGAIFENLMSKT